MRINLIAVGKRMPAWVEDSIKEYSKRLPKELTLNLIEIAPAQRTKTTPVDKTIKEEVERIQTAIPKNNLIIALDEKGKQFSSRTLSKKIDDWIQQAQDISLIIGGAEGLGETFKKSSNEVWSLSKMTLPHALVRVIVAEQIYRAWSIISNHPYHRE
jgi:23S rRNA (pseudouridine1915-N3)-methyltransferase